MKKLFLLILLLIPSVVKAEDITSKSQIIIKGMDNLKLKDSNENTFVTIKKDEEIIIKSNNIHGIYIVYELKSKVGTIKNNVKSEKIGTKGFLHEYLNVFDLIGNSDEIVLSYEEDVKIADIYVLNDNNLPEYVEKWEEPLNVADLVLFSTHSDDEQLFFAGLLPTYVARNIKTQVVYLVNHYDNPKRLHEQLHGLYVVGIRNYPIIGIVPDAYSENLNDAIKNLENSKLKVDDVLNFEVEILRRFKPLVVVGHDELGEYSHGQHILNTHVLKQAIEKANDENYHLNSYNKYGTWNVFKTYLHLYKNNPIVMNYDIPLDYFGGKTAFEVSKIGYREHKSQQSTWFTDWLNGKNNQYKKATDIKIYSPTKFGLYKTLVGNDILKNDMFENIILRKEEIEEEPIINENEIKEEIKQEDIKEEKVQKNSINYLIILIPIGTIIILFLIVKIIYKKRKK